jgi:hypothetical protein
VKTIELTTGEYAIVDDDDYPLLKKLSWHHLKSGKHLIYAATGNPARLMHRMIIAVPDGLYTDHLDGNGLNNQKSNLRIVSHRENMQNVHIKKSSIYPGVTWDKYNEKWRAKIKINGKHLCLGRYDLEIDAFNAYCKKLKEVGELLHEKFVGTC